MCMQRERNAIWITVLCYLVTLTCGVVWAMHGYGNDTLGPVVAWTAASTVWTTRMTRARRNPTRRG